MQDTDGKVVSVKVRRSDNGFFTADVGGRIFTGKVLGDLLDAIDTALSGSDAARISRGWADARSRRAQAAQEAAMAREEARHLARDEAGRRREFSCLE